MRVPRAFPRVPRECRFAAAMGRELRIMGRELRVGQLLKRILRLHFE